jgi:hypothetical protein
MLFLRSLKGMDYQFLKNNIAFSLLGVSVTLWMRLLPRTGEEHHFTWRPTYRTRLEAV